jgi:hypothetical protein
VTYDDLLERIISDGITEVREAYADPKDHHKRDGAIEGFEACRKKSPGELAAMCGHAERLAAQIARDSRATTSENAAVVLDYWRQRYKAMQIEWVCNVVSVALVNGGHAPLLSHLPTARAAMKYAAVVGVNEEVLS